MDELRKDLYLLANLFTKSPVGVETGSKTVKSTPDSGLQVTASISLDKFKPLYSEGQIDEVLTELEKEFSPEIGIYHDLASNSIRFSRFIDKGGPWIEERIPGVKFIFEVGKPIVGQIEPEVLNRSQEMSSRRDRE